MNKTALASILATASLFSHAEDRLQLIQEFRSGSNVSRVIDSASQLPPNLPFYRLLPKQKDVARAWYVGLTQADEPPYPSNGPAFLFDLLRTGAKHLNVTGVVALEVVVAANGRAKTVNLIKTPSKEFGRYAISAALRQSYSSGLCQSLPCEMSYPVAFHIH